MRSRGFAEMGLAGVARAIADGHMRPSDAARLCIEQYDAWESAVSAWTCFDAERLRERARALDAAPPSGPLHGIPIGVKDIFNTQDFPTEMGSPIWTGFTPGNDARSVFHLTRAGALIPGKTTTAEFAVHALSATRNPHDARRTPGTSSSGSAAAVAVGMVPAALGTQTAGSILRPSSFCGVYGFKPSFGLIPRTGMLKTTDSLDTIGFFAAHAADLAIMLDVLRVHGADYPVVDRKFGDSVGGLAPHEGPWRVAMVRGPTWDQAADYAQEALIDWTHRLTSQKGIEIVDIQLPASLATAHETHSTIYHASLAYYFRDESEQGELVSPIMNELIEQGRSIGVDAYRAALTRQEDMVREMEECSGQFDVIATLSTAGVAPPREQMERPDSALIWTLLHLPALSAPVFRHEGLPFGLQLVGSRYSDLRLLEFVRDLVRMDMLPASPVFPTPLRHETVSP